MNRQLFWYWRRYKIYEWSDPRWWIWVIRGRPLGGWRVTKEQEKELRKQWGIE